MRADVPTVPIREPMTCDARCRPRRRSRSRCLCRSLVHRYYDPSAGQFLTVDPLLSRPGSRTATPEMIR